MSIQMIEESQTGPPPLYERILTDVRGRILSGEWPPGHRIPFEHELTRAYGCSRMTVSRALSRLAAVGLIERRRRSGSFVARPHSQSAVLRISDVPEEVKALGLPHRFEILDRDIRRATSDDRRLLEIPVGNRVLDVLCRHDAGEAPFCLERRLINLAAVPEAANERFAAISPGSWLIARVPWTRAENRIMAESPDHGDLSRLGLSQGTACLVVVRRTWRDETPVTRVKLSYTSSHELVARFSPTEAS